MRLVVVAKPLEEVGRGEVVVEREARLRERGRVKRLRADVHQEFVELADGAALAALVPRVHLAAHLRDQGVLLGRVDLGGAALALSTAHLDSSTESAAEQRAAGRASSERLSPTIARCPRAEARRLKRGAQPNARFAGLGLPTRILFLRRVPRALGVLAERSVRAG